MSSRVELPNELKSVSVAGSNSAVTNMGPVILKRSHFVTVAGFLFGAGTQLLFLWTAVKLFLFLRYGGHSMRSFSPTWDVLLGNVLRAPAQHFIAAFGEQTFASKFAERTSGLCALHRDMRQSARPI